MLTYILEHRAVCVRARARLGRRGEGSVTNLLPRVGAAGVTVDRDRAAEVVLPRRAVFQVVCVNKHDI